MLNIVEVTYSVLFLSLVVPRLAEAPWRATRTSGRRRSRGGGKWQAGVWEWVEVNEGASVHNNIHYRGIGANGWIVYT